MAAVSTKRLHLHVRRCVVTTYRPTADRPSWEATRHAYEDAVRTQIGVARDPHAPLTFDTEPDPPGPPHPFVFGASRAGNNFAKGYMTAGAEIIEACVKLVRKQAEQCDFLPDMTLWHAIGEGTGSGLGCLLSEHLRREFPKVVLSSYTILPSPKVTLEPYNAALSLEILKTTLDALVIVDNQQLYDLCHARGREGRIGHLNQDVGLATAILEQPPTNMVPDLVPTPDIKLLTPSVLNGDKFASLCSDRLDVKVFAATGVYSQSSKAELLATCPGHLATQMSAVHDAGGVTKGMAALSNDTGVLTPLGRIQSQFEGMYRRRAFLHWYTGEGMTGDEFPNALEELKKLQSAYEDFDASPLVKAAQC